MAKGSQFERDICRDLSRWWSGGRRDDIFWRTQTSGARATSRSKKGKPTYGQYGDIQAVDPIGKPLMDVITFELKRGYPSVSPFDIFESKVSPWEKWVAQAVRSSYEAGTPYWMIVWKRNRRTALVFYPVCLHDALTSEVGVFALRHMVTFDHDMSLAIMPLENWLDWADTFAIDAIRRAHVK